ncbi:MAG TPA: hypothetical protein DF863_05660 [Gammaproteobacteria bacterium]|jgi:hypothetical protein|nr:hypothetical protein [Arenicellales bacterium]HCV20933.1 hypothetical protein [Gammaproteobacteria bacterium]
MQALTRLQHWLEGVYEIRIDHDVADFVITNPDLAQQLHGSAGRGDCPEKLLVREVQDELNVSLYLAPEIVGHLARVSDSRPRADGRTFCLAIEGVSHFLYLAWRAGFDRTLTQMELELQAEVDKFVGMMTLPEEPLDVDGCARLRAWLFDAVRFAPGLAAEELARYQKANFYAALYCRQLEQRYLRCHDNVGLTRELRRFYRQDQRGKINMIDSAVR